MVQAPSTEFEKEIPKKILWNFKREFPISWVSHTRDTHRSVICIGLRIIWEFRLQPVSVFRLSGTHLQPLFEQRRTHSGTSKTNSVGSVCLYSRRQLSPCFTICSRTSTRWSSTALWQYNSKFYSQ